MEVFARRVGLVGAVVMGVVLCSGWALLAADAESEPAVWVDESVPPACSWYVAADATPGGDGSFTKPFRMPQDAVNRAGAGDFIYLRGAEQHGEFTHQHTPHHTRFVSIDGRRARSGEPNALITLKSYPGERAVIRGAFGENGVPVPAPVFEKALP